VCCKRGNIGINRLDCVDHSLVEHLLREIFLAIVNSFSSLQALLISALERSDEILFKIKR
jgi:hypothetical protein